MYAVYAKTMGTAISAARVITFRVFSDAAVFHTVMEFSSPYMDGTVNGNSATDTAKRIPIIANEELRKVPQALPFLAKKNTPNSPRIPNPSNIQPIMDTSAGAWNRKLS